MNYTDFALLLVYSAAFVLIVVLLLRVLQPPAPPKEVVIVEDRPSTVDWWPWGTTVYNWWPYWGGWWNGGAHGGYSRGYYGRHWTGPGHIQTRPWGGGGRTAHHGAPSRGGPSAGRRSGSGHSSRH